MDFDYKVRYAVEIFGREVGITDTVVNTWILMAVILTLALIARIQLNKYKQVPTGMQNFVELIVDGMDKFVTTNMGEKYSYFGNWFFGVFILALFSNLSGLFALRPPTADLATTVAWALSTFFLIHFMGIVTTKGDYFKGYLDPLPLLLPLNIIGELATPVSLSFRLFGNVLGGMIIMGMFYNLMPIYLLVGIPAALHVYFDVFSGALQAFIFTILSMTFIRGKLAD